MPCHKRLKKGQQPAGIFQVFFLRMDVHILHGFQICPAAHALQRFFRYACAIGACGEGMTRRTGGGRPTHHPQRKTLTGQNKRTLRRHCRKRFTTSNSSGADRYAGKQRAEISRPYASFSIIPPSPPSVNSPLRSEYDHAIMTA